MSAFFVWRQRLITPNNSANHYFSQKKSLFSCIIQKIVVPLHPKMSVVRKAYARKGTHSGGFHLRRACREQEGSGDSLYIEEAFIDALYLTHKKLSTLFHQYSVRDKVSSYAYGYDVHTAPAVSWRAVCHIGVGFIVVY